MGILPMSIPMGAVDGPASRLSAEALKLGEKYVIRGKLGQDILRNLGMKMTDWIGKFIKGGTANPEFRQPPGGWGDKTVREAIESCPSKMRSTLRNFMTQERF